MTVLLVLYILGGQFLIAEIPFNSYTACETVRSAVNEPAVCLTIV